MKNDYVTHLLNPPPREEDFPSLRSKIFYLICYFNFLQLIAIFNIVHNMKICLRYPPPKSSSSGGGLSIASL